MRTRSKRADRVTLECTLLLFALCPYITTENSALIVACNRLTSLVEKQWFTSQIFLIIAAVGRNFRTAVNVFIVEFEAINSATGLSVRVKKKVSKL